MHFCKPYPNAPPVAQTANQAIAQNRQFFLTKYRQEIVKISKCILVYIHLGPRSVQPHTNVNRHMPPSSHSDKLIA